MNRFEGRGPATRFGYSHEARRADEGERFGAGQTRGGERDRSGYVRARDPRFEGGSMGDAPRENWGGPEQGGSRGGSPSNGPDRGWDAAPAWARDDDARWRGEGAPLPEGRDRFADESYRDREGRFGTTYGMSQGNRDFGRGTYADADFRDDGPHTGYQEHEGWGGRGLEEGRSSHGQPAYDPRYSRQDARRFGGEARFGQGWEADRFQSRSTSSQTYSPSDHSGTFGGPGRGGWDRDDRFGSSAEHRFTGGFGSFPPGSRDVDMRQGGGSFVGRGPKGYQRSDARIREEICELLSRQGHLDVSEVEVKVSGGEVILGGTVTRRGDKLDIEHLVEHVSGVKDVRNEIRRVPLTSGQSQHTGNLTTASAPNPGGSPATAKTNDGGNENPTARHSS